MSFQTLPLYNLLTQCLLLVTLYDFVRQLIDISKLLSIGLAAAAATLGAMYVDARYSIRSDLSHVLAARKVEKGQVSLRVIHQMGIITLDDTDTRWMKPGTSAIFTTVSRTKPGLCLTECTFCMTIDHILFASSSKVRQLSK